MVFVDRMLVPHPLSWRSFTSDRRDALLMLQSQRHPQWLWLRLNGEGQIVAGQAGDVRGYPLGTRFRNGTT
jgi:hypothetical protein